MTRSAAGSSIRLDSANAVSVLWVLAGTFLFSVVLAAAKVVDTDIAPLRWSSSAMRWVGGS